MSQQQKQTALLGVLSLSASMSQQQKQTALLGVLSLSASMSQQQKHKTALLGVLSLSASMSQQQKQTALLGVLSLSASMSQQKHGLHFWESCHCVTTAAWTALLRALSLCHNSSVDCTSGCLVIFCLCVTVPPMWTALHGSLQLSVTVPQQHQCGQPFMDPCNCLSLCHNSTNVDSPSWILAIVCHCATTAPMWTALHGSLQLSVTVSQQHQCGQPFMYPCNCLSLCHNSSNVDCTSVSTVTVCDCVTAETWTALLSVCYIKTG
ncbi:hypothetical protein BsWGS_28046 [Bradybaena similaris]